MPAGEHPFRRKLIAPVLAAGAIWFAAAAPASAVTLVHPDGSPAPTLQRWADQMQVATYSGRVTIVSTALCRNPNVLGCAIGPPYYPYYGNSFAIGVSMSHGRAMARYVLIEELAHIFDWAYLDGWAHLGFAQLWHVAPDTPWLDSPTGLANGTEDGLEGSFQVAYGKCAIGNLISTSVSWGIGSSMPVIAFGPSSCAAIHWIATLHGGTMPLARASAARHVWAAAADVSMTARTAFARAR